VRFLRWVVFEREKPGRRGYNAGPFSAGEVTLAEKGSKHRGRVYWNEESPTKGSGNKLVSWRSGVSKKARKNSAGQKERAKRAAGPLLSCPGVRRRHKHNLLHQEEVENLNKTKRRGD